MVFQRKNQGQRDFWISFVYDVDVSVGKFCCDDAGEFFFFFF